MLGNYLIGLREGLEAALVIGILAAYLVRIGRSGSLRWLWLGAGTAIAASAALGAILTVTARDLPEQAEALLAGTLSVVAVVLITAMVFWMKRHSHSMKGALHSEIDKTFERSGWALALVGFLAVGREGAETSLFLWAAAQSDQAPGRSLAAALAGLGTSAVIGWLAYRGAIRFNLAMLFRWTGVVLIVMSAGVLSHAVTNLAEAGIIAPLGNPAFDLSSVFDPNGIAVTLLSGILSLSLAMTWLEIAVWLAYLGPVLYFYLRPGKVPSPSTAHAPEDSHVEYQHLTGSLDPEPNTSIIGARPTLTAPSQRRSAPVPTAEPWHSDR